MNSIHAAQVRPRRTHLKLFSSVHVSQLVLLILAAFAPLAFGQSGLWTWSSGNSSAIGAGAGRPGIYGTLDTPSPNNLPGAHKGAATWVDNNGHLWMFGGAGFDANSTQGYLNDLWEFDPAAVEWTWRGGSSTIPAVNSCQAGHYGTRGTADPANVPGGRTGAAFWADASGNFWLFGGAGCDASGADVNLNDLWKLDPSTGNWTWVAGNDIQGTAGTTAGVYGTLGSPSSSNMPGSRDFAVGWTDPSGKLWLFGGFGANSAGGQTS